MQFQWSPWTPQPGYCGISDTHTAKQYTYDGLHTCASNGKHDEYANLEGETIIVDILTFTTKGLKNNNMILTNFWSNK